MKKKYATIQVDDVILFKDGNYWLRGVVTKITRTRVKIRYLPEDYIVPRPREVWRKRSEIETLSGRLISPIKKRESVTKSYKVRKPHALKVDKKHPCERAVEVGLPPFIIRNGRTYWYKRRSQKMRESELIADRLRKRGYDVETIQYGNGLAIYTHSRRTRQKRKAKSSAEIFEEFNRIK